MAEKGGNSNTLKEKINQAGFNYEFYKGVTNLESLKEYVAKGQVSQEVYKQIEDSFLRVHTKSPQTSKAKKGRGMFGSIANFNPLKRPNKKSPADKIREQGSPTKRTASRSRGLSLRSRGESVKSGYSQRSLRSLRTPQPEAKPIVQGELMKFVKKKKKKEWKALYVVLYPTRIDFLARKGEKKVLKSIELNDDFYISELNKGQLKRAKKSPSAENLNPGENLSMSDEEDEDDYSRGLKASPEVRSMPHVFVISDINQKNKIFLAADSEEKKSYWVTMTCEVLRDIQLSERTGTKIWDEVESRANNYVAKKLGKNMNPDKLTGVTGDQMTQKLNRFEKQGRLAARKSVVHDWQLKERNRVAEVEKENQMLTRRLEDKSKELKELRDLKDREVQQIRKEKEEEREAFREKEKELLKFKELNSEWQSKYNDLMEKYRAEAHARNQDRLKEEKRIQNEIRNLKRRSVMPGGGEGRDYEAEIEMYRRKLETLQKALNVDMDALDWDGTLEQAEERMGECLKLIIDGETPQIQAKAQQDFDKWDQLVRNHEDYLNREKIKWEKWENENREKNLAALQEMKDKFVPEIFSNGCSEKDLIAATGMKQKTAARVRKNNIFKFFWWSKDRIAKIHAADLLNSYACQGLDIRELRAVYATLPDEFQNDNDGKKKTFRDNLRGRLSELTKKEADGKLSLAEQLNNAYRDKAVREAKPKMKKHKRKAQGVNNKLKGQAAMLEAFFNKQNGPAPKKKSPAKSNGNGGASNSAANGAKKKAGLDVNDEKWNKYFKMQKMNLPDGAIEQKMMKDGEDPGLWQKLKDLKKSGGGAPKPKADKFDADSPEYTKYFKMQKMGLADGAIMNKMVQEGKDPGLWEKLKAAKEKETPDEKPAKLDVEDPVWEQYFKMKKLGLGEGQIQNKMQKDGRDPMLWPRLLEMKEKLNAKKQPSKKVSPFDFAADKPKAVDSNDNKEAPEPSKTKPKRVKKRLTITQTEVDDDIAGESSVAADMKRAIKMKRKSKTGKPVELDENGDPIKKKKKKKSKTLEPEETGDGVILTKKSKTRRKTKKNSKTESHLLQGSKSALLRKIQIDEDLGLDNLKRGSHAMKLMDYGEHVGSHKTKRGSVLAGTLRGAGGAKIRNSKVGTGINVGEKMQNTLDEVKTVIIDEGFHDPVEGGIKSMKFGDLAMKFTEISDVLMGVLMKGQRSGEIKYTGNMLFLGIHDNVKITVMKFD